MATLLRLSSICLIPTVIFLLFIKNDTSQAQANFIVIPLAAASISLDPRLVLDQSSLWVGRQLNCQLVRYDGAQVVNDAAEKISYLDPKTIEIKLKSGVQFSNETLLNAKDVVATFAFLKRSRKYHRNIFQWVQSIQIKSDHVIWITLKKPMPQFLKTLAAPTQALYPALFIKKAQKDPSLWQAPIGCGSYRLNRHFIHNTGHPALELIPTKNKDSFSIHFVLTGTSTVQAKEVTQFDLIGLPIEGNADGVLKKEFESIQLFDPYQIYIAINTKLKEGSTKESRCQFLKTFNPSSILPFYQGQAEMALDWFPRGILGYSAHTSTVSNNDNNAQSNFDQKITKNFVTDQQLKNSKKCLGILAVSIPEFLRNHYLSLFNKTHPGAPAKVIYNTKEFGKEFLLSQCDALVFGLKSGYLDGYEFIQFFVEKEVNVTGWEDMALQKLILKSQDMEDPSQRAIAYQHVAATIQDNCLAKALVSIPYRQVFYKRKLSVPNIGKSALNAYNLSAVR